MRRPLAALQTWQGGTMNYTFQFGVAFAQLPELLKGAVITFELGLLTFWGGALIITAAWNTSGRTRALNAAMGDPRSWPMTAATDS